MTVGAGCPVYLFDPDGMIVNQEGLSLFVSIDGGPPQTMEPVVSMVELEVTKIGCNFETCTSEPRTVGVGTASLMRFDFPTSVAGSSIGFSQYSAGSQWVVTVTTDGCAPEPTVVTQPNFCEVESSNGCFRADEPEEGGGARSRRARVCSRYRSSLASSAFALARDDVP